MRDPTPVSCSARNQSITLPRYAPAAGLIIAVGAGMCLAGPAGTHASGGRVASLLTGLPLPVEMVVDRRRRMPTTASLALSEIRRWTNLAWGSVAELLGVSRRTVHNWASGEEPTGVNIERLAQLHERARELHERHGPVMAGTTLAIENGATARISRTSPRALPADAPPILSAEFASDTPVLRVAGRRKRVRLRQA